MGITSVGRVTWQSTSGGVVTVGGAAVMYPLAARAQEVALPVIGFVGSGSPEAFWILLAALRQGLKDTGFVEPRNCRIEFYRAFDQFDRLPALATKLVGQNPAVIITAGGLQPALAAKAATSTIPIVFASVSDPVENGLVASLNRPGGNMTGVNALLKEVNAKRMELLRELVPHAELIGIVANPSRADASKVISEIEVAARALGQRILVARAATPFDIDVAIAELVQKRIGALLIASDPLFTSQREKLVALSVQNSLPSSLHIREFPVAGGLMSYGASLTDAFRQVGVYTGKILKGAKPADLPVMQAVKIEFVINLRTAKTLGLDIPPKLLALADEVVE
jgi:putative tryptophan/tyrosine transport system substrate-binding protein